MRVLVTGATGFVGSQLARRFARERYTVRALVRDGSDARDLEAAGIEIVRGDVLDSGAVERAVAGCELVYHLAVHRTDRAVSVDGTANVARAAARAGSARLLFTSSTRAYGRTQGRIDEDAPLRPYPGHGKLKVAAERMLRAMNALPVVIARLPLVLGRGNKSWLGVFQAIQSRRFQWIGTGANRHHPADVDDVVEGLWRCGTVRGIEGKTYLIVGPEARSLREIVGYIDNELGTETMPSRMPVSALRVYRRLNDVVVACGGNVLPRFDRVSLFLDDRIFDLSRARRELGFEPTVTVRETIARTAQWFRERGLLPPRCGSPG